MVESNITYLVAAGYEAKLDVYMSKRTERPKPTIVYIHGGGWAGGPRKEHTSLFFLPFMQLGWNVVSVEYRRSSISLAPAAVEDCLCALRWVENHAAEYNVDIRQIVIMGRSAGGLLALTTGMVPPTSILVAPCINMTNPNSNAAADATAKPAAIVNWFGITDVADLLDGPNKRDFAVAWIGAQSNRSELAAMVSPITYVREGVPPIVTIHGDKDSVVPYDHAVRLHKMLTNAHVLNKLITIHGGDHGDFGATVMTSAFTQVVDFLNSVGLTVKPDKH